MPEFSAASPVVFTGFFGDVSDSMIDGSRALAVVSRSLAAVPNPEIDRAFAERLEEMLIGTSSPFDHRVIHLPVRNYSTRLSVVRSNDQGPGADVIAFPRKKFIVRKSMLAALAAAMLIVAPILASASALPGTALYGLRTAIERLQLITADDAVAKGFVDLRLAQNRLADVGELLALQQTAYVTPTLKEMDRLLREGTTLIVASTRSEASLKRLATILQSSSRVLGSLISRAPRVIEPALALSLAEDEALTKVVVQALEKTQPSAVAPSGIAPTMGSAYGIKANAGGASSDLGISPSITEPADVTRSPSHSGDVRVEKHDSMAACPVGMDGGPGRTSAGAACRAAAVPEPSSACVACSTISRIPLPKSRPAALPGSARHDQSSAYRPMSAFLATTPARGNEAAKAPLNPSVAFLRNIESKDVSEKRVQEGRSSRDEGASVSAEHVRRDRSTKEPEQQQDQTSG